jgi:hypothetical protein
MHYNVYCVLRTAFIEPFMYRLMMSTFSSRNM